MHGTIYGNTGSVYLGETKDVKGLDAELLLDTGPHLRAPTLGTYDTHLQINIIPQTPFVDLFCRKSTGM